MKKEPTIIPKSPACKREIYDWNFEYVPFKYRKNHAMWQNAKSIKEQLNKQTKQNIIE